MNESQNSVTKPHVHSTKNWLKDGTIYHFILLTWGYRIAYDNGIIKSMQYRHWKRFMDNWVEIKSSMKMNPQNCAHLAFFGVTALQSNNYKKAFKLLKRSNDMCSNSVVQAALAETFIKLNQFKSAQKILHHLLINIRWKDITQYLTSCCIEPTTKQLNYNSNELLTVCFHHKLENEIKLKSILQLKKSLLCTVSDMNEMIEADNSEHFKDILSELVRTTYWNNQYQESYQYMQQLSNICHTYSLTLDSHEMRLCFLLLHRLDKPVEFFNLSDEQMKLLDSIPQKDRKDCWNEQRMSHVVFGLLAIAESPPSSGDKSCGESLVNMLLSYRIDTCCETHSRQHYSNTIIAEYYAASGNLQNANRYFAKAAIYVIDRFEEIMKTGCRRGCHHLCLNTWLLFYLYAKYVHYKLGNLKIAKYIYQIALELNPYDVMTHYHYSILLFQIGKHKNGDTHWNKARQLNRVHLKNYPRIQECISTTKKVVYVECNYCQNRVSNFKVCGRCKSVFYCSRKCQKLDWNRDDHGKHCVFKNESSNRVRAYIIKKLYSP